MFIFDALHNMKTDQKIATILGTLFGGILLGAVITTIITIITKRARDTSSPNRRSVVPFFFFSYL